MVKLDMCKAYDRLEWDFLEACLKGYGFDLIWVQRVMKYASGVSFRYEINRVPSQRVFLKQGLWQWDFFSL